jgi:dihydrodipicolinate synthase/N-acetylneuraminate lyase
MTCVPANVLPKSYRQYIDLYEKREFERLRPIHAGLLRFQQLIERYRSTEARWVKICWHILQDARLVVSRALCYAERQRA